MPWALGSSERLFIYFPLQGHERVQQGFRTWRTAWNVHIHWNVTINALEHIVALLERSTGNGTSSHSNHIFGFRHLVKEAYHLRRHFFGHRASDDHQVCLSG